MKKLFKNGIYSLIAAIVLSLLLPIDKGKVIAGGIIFVFFFVMATFFADDEFNITANWSGTAIKVKNIIGNILAAILLSGAWLMIFTLVGILIGADSILIGAVITVVFLFTITASARSAHK